MEKSTTLHSLVDAIHWQYSIEYTTYIDDVLKLCVSSEALTKVVILSLSEDDMVDDIQVHCSTPPRVHGLLFMNEGEDTLNGVWRTEDNNAFIKPSEIMYYMKQVEELIDLILKSELDEESFKVFAEQLFKWLMTISPTQFTYTVTTVILAILSNHILNKYIIIKV